MNEDLAQQSSVHPVIAVAMLVAIVFLFAMPRRKLIVPFIFAGILIPMDQILVVGPLHFQMIQGTCAFHLDTSFHECQGVRKRGFAQQVQHSR